MQKFNTRAIHVGQEPDPVYGAVVPPLYLTSTFAQEAPGQDRGFDYSRAGNPTRAALEACLASLEGASFGHSFGSGLAAISGVLSMFGPGTHVVGGNDLYGGTFRYFNQVLEPQGYSFSFVDPQDVMAFEAAIRPETKLVWLETPTNPLLKVTDIEAVVAKVKAKNPNIIVGVDNTFASPYLQNPLALGADLVMHSTTKYIGGHSDLVGGVVVTSDKEISEKLNFAQRAMGAIPGPFDCWLQLRGVKTLGVRMDRQQQNAAALAAFLEGHKQVARVIYPGLSSHPGHEVAKKQMKGFGAMVSFELAGTEAQAKAFTTHTQVFILAESLGGIESLLEHPASMTHASMSPELRQQAGIGDGLIRLSVGLEDLDDLRADLEGAFAKVV